MKAHGRYECGGNFFKLDMLYNASAGVPIIASRIAKFADHHFKTPTPLPLPCHVAMPSRHRT